MEQVRCMRSGRSPDSDVASIVTERDWNVLLATAVEVELAPGTRLVEQGLENGILYRLVEGRLLVEKASPSYAPSQPTLDSSLLAVTDTYCQRAPNGSGRDHTPRHRLWRDEPLGYIWHRQRIHRRRWP